MSPIIRTTFALVLVLLSALYLLTISGCGDANSRATYDPDTGSHPGGWLPSGHAGPALAHLQDCTECHGQDLSGGISKVACSRCHLGVGFVGPANTLTVSVHPFGWDGLTYALHGPYVDQHGTAACANAFCHGTSLQGAAGPSCTACHLGGPLAVHPPEWNVQLALHGGYVLQHGTASCRNAVCHGPQLQGVFLSGPACAECHGNTTFP